jgi:hypothetical protein
VVLFEDEDSRLVFWCAACQTLVMSERGSDKSHAMTWALSILTVPVLYLLTLPPVILLTLKLSPHPTSPSWLDVYCKPSNLICKSVPPLQRPMSAYYKWWARVMGYPIP